MMRKHIHFIVLILLMIPFYGKSQVYDTLMQKTHRKELDDKQQYEIHREVRQLIDSCIIWMSEVALSVDDEKTMNKLRGCFVENIIESDTSKKIVKSEEKVIYNFFQPTLCDDSIGQHPRFYSVDEYIKFIQQWYPQGIDLIHGDILISAYYEKFRRDRVIFATVPINFIGYTKYECNKMSKQTDTTLTFKIKLDDWFQPESGAELPGSYKIDFVNLYYMDSCYRPYKNLWSFLDLAVNYGVSSPSYELADDNEGVLYDFESLEALPKQNYSIEAKFNFFLQDTFAVDNKVRLWEVGFGSGVRYMHQAWEWNTNEISLVNENMKISPINYLELENYDLHTNGKSIKETESLDVLSIPVTFQLRRYFGSSKVNSILLDAGLYINFMLNHDYTIDNGTLSYVGENCVFRDTVNGVDYPPITIDNLGYYGFQTYTAKIDDQQTNETLYKDIYYSCFFNLLFDLRKNFKSNLHWKIGPYFEYTFSNLINERNGNFIGYEGNIQNITNSLSKLNPYSLGIRVGITYNYWSNKKQKKCK